MANRTLTLLLVLLTFPASAVTMSWTPIGNPGNPADTAVMNDGTTGYGSVGYAYSIGTYDVTNAQYAEFLNAKATSDPLGLYNTEMGGGYGGITRSGSSGSFSYAPISSRDNMPVNFVSIYDALRFANWLNNGQGSSDTETGAYTITNQGIVNNSITRNAGATIFLTSEDEWYKAAYYDALTTSYFAYPAGSNTEMTCTTPTAAPNSANCTHAVSDLTPVGSYTGSASPYGTFDQGGNVYQWDEAIISGSFRGVRGGSFAGNAFNFRASLRNVGSPTDEEFATGFRLAMIPEPSTGLLVAAGLVGLAGRRRMRA